MRLFYCLFFFFTAFITKAQPVSFQKVIGGNELEWGSDILQLPNNDYLILGQTKSFGAGNFDSYLIKTDSLGNVIWKNIYGNSMDESTDAMKYSKTDSSIYIVGNTNSFGYDDIFLMKLDLEGDTVWTKTYGDSTGQDFVKRSSCISLTKDSGCIITGHGSLDNSGLLILKLNNNGDTIWTKQSGSSYDRGYSVLEINDGYIINGLTGNLQTNALAIYLLKLNFDGDTLWTKTYDSPQIDQPYKTLQTKDGGYITCGFSDSFDSSLYFHIFLLKTDSAGDTLWTKLYRGNNYDYAYDIEATNDGGYIISGETKSFGFGSYDAYLLKIDSVGNMKWMKTYGGTGNEYAHNVSIANDGGFIISASTFNFGSNDGDIYFIKTDSLGNSGGCNEMDVTSQVQVGYAPFEVKNIGNTFTSGGAVNNIAVNITSGGTDSTLCNGDTVGVTELEIINNEVKIFPNPATNHLWIEYQTVNAKEFAEIRIFDLLGKETLIQKLVNGQQRISTSNLENGVYIYRILINEIPKESGKLIISKN